MTPAKSFLKYAEQPERGDLKHDVVCLEKVLPPRQESKTTHTQAIRPFIYNTCPRTFTTKIGRANHSKSCSSGVVKDNNNNINSNNVSEAPAAAQPPKSLTSSSSGREVDIVTQDQNDAQFTPL